ncbi:hypothetical protein BU14_0269s0021 [Porphyra umbilicalis]|uniref:Uncharacterized protein n=1 Tax=Porphyra umbilicalis TaxID=2786 RepID=A0A1X6P1H3_PORUM|nr:hypothetical protein BU14_0269s0021 [Porphyra umbilicalis]|eukprot:OSX74741.1 hypothetical protein BU14_0269s0021 [Porphyra umbilicalis]
MRWGETFWDRTSPQQTRTSVKAAVTWAEDAAVSAETPDKVDFWWSDAPRDSTMWHRCLTDRSCVWMSANGGHDRRVRTGQTMRMRATRHAFYVGRPPRERRTPTAATLPARQ